MRTSSWLAKLGSVRFRTQYQAGGETMKIKRFVALAVIALLVIGAMGVISYRVFARQNTNPVANPQPCNQQDDDSAEEQDSPDTDDIEEQCGDQVENEADDANEAAESSELDAADELAPVQTGISADRAQSIAEGANPGAATLAVEFDREGGKDDLEVELDNGLDVKMDASSGAILGSEVRD
jgi:uncharacterized membrane protein YkoI